MHKATKRAIFSFCLNWCRKIENKKKILKIFKCFTFPFYRMAMNASLSKMSDTKTDQYIFSWKIFGGWDYTIGNTETACNTAMAIVIKLRVRLYFLS